MSQSARVKARSPLWRCEWRKRKGRAPCLCCGERTKLSPGGDSTRVLGGKLYTGKFRIFSEQKWWCHCGYLRSLDFPCTTNPHPSTEFHAPTSEPQRSSAPICIRVSLLTAGLEERSATTRLLVSTLGKCLHQGVFCHRIQSIRLNVSRCYTYSTAPPRDGPGTECFCHSDLRIRRWCKQQMLFTPGRTHSGVFQVCTGCQGCGSGAQAGTGPQ